MATEAAFEGAGQKPGLEIWRIEKMVPTPVDPAYYGTFYSGDSYIVLATVDSPSGYDYSLHFWLGADTSQDESTVAAYKSVELDQSLGDKPIQYRECEGHESTLFCSHFKSMGGVQYLAGGVASGMNHVEPDSYETRLLQIKGKRNARTKQVAPEASSLNAGDVFLLDAGLKLFLWCGAEANTYEKAKGAQVLTKLRNQRGARPEVVLMDDEPDNSEFWAALSGSAADVQPASAGGSDTDAVAVGEPKLFKVSNESGSLEVTEVPLQKKLPAVWEQLEDDEGTPYYHNTESDETVWERPEGDASEPGRLLRTMLDTNDVFLLDCETEIFCWIGRGANAEEKKDGMKSASAFVESQSRPSWTRVTRVVERAETVDFKAKFYQWDPPRSFDFTAKSSGVAGGAGREIVQKEIDAASMHASAAQSMVDDGSGEVTVYRITDTERLDVPKEKYGQFFAGDSYLVHYQYESSGLAHIIYYYLGKESSTLERGAAAARCVELTDSLGNADVTQVRVVQGKEPPHFCALFKGSMIVYSSGAGGELADDGSPHLFHVKGTTPENTKAVEVPASASNLNSGDCFVVTAPGATYLWYGTGSSEEEQATAANIAEMLKGAEELTVYAEGGEEPAFWEALGGEASYPDASALPPIPSPPRLFHVSDVTGQVTVEEIPQFSQEDLIDEDVLLLDCVLQLFVWVGSKASTREKAEGMEIAQKYIAAATDGRDADTPVIRVNAGREPALFTSNFQGWEKKPAGGGGFVDPYEARLAALRAEKEKQEAAKPKEEGVVTSDDVGAGAGAGAGSGAAAAAPAAPAGPSASGTYTYDVLKAARRGDLDIDFTKKPDYLADDEFATVFSMSRDEYNALPKWKQANKKKEVGLF